MGENFATPLADEFMAQHWSIMVGMGSNYVKVIFKEKTGSMPGRKSPTCWYSELFVLLEFVLPYLSDGKLLQWALAVQAKGLCEKSVPRMIAFLKNAQKVTLLLTELTVLESIGSYICNENTGLEGDGFNFITDISRVDSMKSKLNSPLDDTATSKLKEIAAEAPKPKRQPRKVKRKPTIQQLRLALVDRIFDDVNPTTPDDHGTFKVVAVEKKDIHGEEMVAYFNDVEKERPDGVQEDCEHIGALELFEATWANWKEGKPTIASSPDVSDVSDASAPFLLASENLTDPKVLEAYGQTVLAGAKAYFNNTFLVKRGGFSSLSK